MKAKAIYIPELGETFFIEEIISISDIVFKQFDKDGFKYGSFSIDFNDKKKKTITNYEMHSLSILCFEDEDECFLIQKFDIKHLEKIRNEFFKYINIINAQETDKE